MLKENKGFWPFVILLALALVAVNLIWFLNSLDKINRGVADLQLSIAGRAAGEINIFLESRENLLRGLSNAVVVVDAAQQRGLIWSFLSEEKDFERISFADANGLEKHRFKRSFNQLFEEKPENIVLTERFWQTLSGLSHIGLVFISENLGPVVSIAVPVIDPESREVVGSVAADLSLRSMVQLIRDITPSPTGKVYVVDHLGRLIVDPDPALISRGISYTDRALIAETLEKQAALSGLAPKYRYQNEKGIEMVASSAFVSESGWVAVVEEQSETAFAAVVNVKRLASVLFIISVFLAAAIVFSLKNITRLISILNLEKRQTAAIISNLTDGLIEYSEDFKIKLINPEAEKIFGVSASEVVGRKFEAKDVSKPKFVSLARVLFPILAEKARFFQADLKNPKTIELEIFHPVQRDLQVVTVPVLGQQGQIFSYLKIIRDVSRERAISRVKSEFISLAAHQLRTPLSAIKWIFKMLLDGDVGKLSQEQESFMQKGYDSNERIIKLVNDLLDVTRIEEGRFGYKLDWADLQKIIEDEVDRLSLIADKKGLVLSFSRSGEPLPELKMDVERIRIVLENLIDNAMQYTLSGGKIEITLQKEDVFAKVSIRDSGVGISEEEKKRLFTKFFRGANVIKMQTEGTGLGLFISKNIIASHGGKIWVESKENQGSTFYFTLPLKESMIPPKELAFREFIEGF